MASIWDSIGTRFEDIVQERFTDFGRCEDLLVPDFFNGDFWLEAKVGFWDFGVQIKRYQVDAFRSMKKPVVYLIGFHDFEKSMERLGSLSGKARARLLRKKMGIQNAYFVSDSVVRGIWRRESRPSAKAGRVYCTLKRQFLDAVIENGKFKRGGKEHNARDQYGVRPAMDFLFREPERSCDNPYGIILNKGRDEKVIEYLRERDIIRP